MAQRADAIMPRARQVRRRDPEQTGFSRRIASCNGLAPRKQRAVDNGEHRGAAEADSFG